MAIAFSKLDQRLKVEGKDATNRFANERRNFIADTCVEITTTQDYYWLEETWDSTIPSTNTDWIDLPFEFHKSLEVYVSGKRFTYISERDYAMDNYRVTTLEPYGFYRLRYNDTKSKFQIAFLNPPAAGTAFKVLYKKYLNSPEQFPDFMEEVLIRGSLYRFLAFQEGDDFEVALNNKEDFGRLANQQDRFGNQNLSDKPRRTKTLNEIYAADTNNRYGR